MRREDGGNMDESSWKYHWKYPRKQSEIIHKELKELGKQ